MLPLLLFRMAGSGCETTGEPQSKKKRIQSISKDVDDATKSFISEKFLVYMPQEFYDFWEFLCDADGEYPGRVLAPYHLR